MPASATLSLYFVVVFGIIALPGMDMAFVMATASLGGRRAGMAAVAGIVAGGLCHLLMAGLGVAAILHWWPALFQAMLAGGAAYIAWMGIAFLRSAGFALPGHATAPVTPRQAFRRALLTNLVNPKAYVFMIAIFPQFLQPAAGPLWLQAGVLGTITALTQAGVYGALALAASRASGWLARHPGASRLVARLTGALLLAVAALTAVRAIDYVPG
ncbi:MAG: LysE family translocator [Pseudomonadota bacterium]|nr:LysE family translocator [Pseudomonadota bacterium]